MNIVVNDKIIILDEEDFLKLKDKRFEIYHSRDSDYVYVFLPERVLLHRHVLSLTLKDGVVVDHINRNTLDNRKSNLRKGSHSDNLRNRGKCYASTSSLKVSKYKGVCFEKYIRKYIANLRFKIGDKKYRQTVYVSKSEEECGYAYDYACKMVAPIFSYLNNVQLEENLAQKIQQEVDRRLAKYFV